MSSLDSLRCSHHLMKLLPSLPARARQNTSTRVILPGVDVVQLLVSLSCRRVNIFNCCSAPDRGAEYCDKCDCLSLCVCLSTIISSELHVRSSPNFCACYLWPCLGLSLTADTIRYVLSVLWMTSYLLISQGCSTSPASWSAVHKQPWAWL